VRQLPHPFTKEQLYADEPEHRRTVMQAAMRCRFCEQPSCCRDTDVDVPGILRRVAVGNFAGAKKRYLERPAEEAVLAAMEPRCVRAVDGDSAVEILRVIRALKQEDV